MAELVAVFLGMVTKNETVRRSQGILRNFR